MATATIRIEAVAGVAGVAGAAHPAAPPPSVASRNARTAPSPSQFVPNEAAKNLSIGGHSRCRAGITSGRMTPGASLGKFEVLEEAESLSNLSMGGRSHCRARIASSRMSPSASLGKFEVLGDMAGEEEEEVRQFFGNGDGGGGDVALDGSVFEEAFTSVRRATTKRAPGTRVRGVPIPRSTLVPDDWKAVQAYQERGKKERKVERRELELDWARRLAAQRREARPMAGGRGSRPGDVPRDGDSAVSRSAENSVDESSGAFRSSGSPLHQYSAASNSGKILRDGDSAAAVELGENRLEEHFDVVRSTEISTDGDAGALHLEESSLDGDVDALEVRDWETPLDGRFTTVGLDMEGEREGDDTDWEELEAEEGDDREPASSSGRAHPKDVRAELEFSGFEDIAQSLRDNDSESRRLEDARNGARGMSEDSSEAGRRAAVTLTPEEKASLRAKTLDFARITSNSWSPLQTFAASGQVFLAAELLRKGGVDVDAVDGDGLTALHRAVQAGRKTMVRMLVKAGANCRVRDGAGATLMHYSARLGNDDICKVLLRNGVDIDTADAEGWTALHVAVQSGRVELVKALVYRGADMTLKTNDGCTALDMALAFGGCFNFYDTIKFLKKRMVLDVESGPQAGPVNRSV